jgi:hypothetical protein
MARLAPAVCLLLLFALTMEAEPHKYYLPVLPGTESMDMGPALTNLGATEATVSLTARDYSGSLIAGLGITNPAIIRIPPSAQRALRTPKFRRRNGGKDWLGRSDGG